MLVALIRSSVMDTYTLYGYIPYTGRVWLATHRPMVSKSCAIKDQLARIKGRVRRIARMEGVSD